MVQNFLIARRLVEAGARVVSLNYSRWDWHGGDGMNFPRSRQEFPLLDQGLSALITDLHDRGLDQDVSVVVGGGFGGEAGGEPIGPCDHGGTPLGLGRVLSRAGAGRLLYKRHTGTSARHRSII